MLGREDSVVGVGAEARVRESGPGAPEFVVAEEEAVMSFRRAARKVGRAEASMSAALSRVVMMALGVEVWMAAASASVASARGS